MELKDLPLTGVSIARWQSGTDVPKIRGSAATQAKPITGQYVIKRDGSTEPVSLDKITRRISILMEGLNREYVDPIEIAGYVCACFKNSKKGVHTSTLDDLSAETCLWKTLKFPDYGKLASRICISNFHKSTQTNWLEVCTQLRNYVEPRTGKHSPLLSEAVYKFIMDNGETFQNALKYNRDYDFDFFGFQTLHRSYLLKINGKVVERPQHMLMRAAAQIHLGDLKSALQTYNDMSEQYYIHATPTLFNSGTMFPQLSSCFLLRMLDDSIAGIYETLKWCALISKQAGGIGVDISNVRAAGSYIAGTNGESNGLVPMIRNFNSTARYVDQGGGKRKGAFAIYIQPWHADIVEVLHMKDNKGPDEIRARDLFYALWIPDIFFYRVTTNGNWPLFCPHDCPGLDNTWGKEFNELFLKYEKAGKARKVMKARDLWGIILDVHQETGTPYMLAKDAINRKSNQRNLGTIKSSNLCVEICEYTSTKEVAVCNLASMSLPKYVNIPIGPVSQAEATTHSLTYDPSKRRRNFNHHLFHEKVQQVVRNLNNVIDLNWYPLKEARDSNLAHRPIGLGVQGMAECFMKMNIPFDSDEAEQENFEIFETLYHAALTASCELAKRDGVYPSYYGTKGGYVDPENKDKFIPPCPMAEGKLQFDLWDDEVKEKIAEREQWRKEGKLMDVAENISDKAREALEEEGYMVETPSERAAYEQKYLQLTKLTDRWDWTALRNDIALHGVRNSLMVAPMPTASTSQILKNTESFEPRTSNVGTRRTLVGEIPGVNEILVDDLIEAGIWSEELMNQIIAANGKIGQLKQIPQWIRDKHKTVWEISHERLANMAAARGRFIDQSQSFNCYMPNVTYGKQTSALMHAWRKGLKSLQYYLRTKPAANAIKFSLSLEEALETLTTDSEKKDVKEASEKKKIETVKVEAVPAKESVHVQAAVVETTKVCPMRKKGQPIDEACLACGS